jgi:hypothetical protein
VTAWSQNLRDADVILASLVPKEDWQDIRNYHVHVIVTTTDLWIKNVYKESDDECILISDNEHHDPFVVLVKDIHEVWVMRLLLPLASSPTASILYPTPQHSYTCWPEALVIKSLYTLFPCAKFIRMC